MALRASGDADTANNFQLYFPADTDTCSDTGKLAHQQSSNTIQTNQKDAKNCFEARLCSGVQLNVCSVVLYIYMYVYQAPVKVLAAPPCQYFYSSVI